ncbi:MAG: tetratricopeptide repeat protein [Candidatus Glassbacteria bacterium]
MRLKCFILLFLISLLSFVVVNYSVSDSSFTSRFQEANDHYAAGEYCTAKEVYGGLIKDGMRSAALFYNMGNACFKCGELGRSILYYEKAIKISPRDSEIRFNLSFARKSVAETPTEEGILHAILSRTLFFFSTGELLRTEEIAVVALALSGMLFINSRRRKFKRFLKISICITGIVLILSLLLLSVKFIDESSSEAIVVVERVDALSGPGEENMRVLSIPEGMKVWIDEEREEWYLVHLSTGRGGWVKRDTVEII